MICEKKKMNMVVKRSKIGACNGSGSRSKRRRIHSCVLPDDVLFMILLLLPADFIYNVMRFVCKQWYNIIQSPIFISSHFENSLKTNCLLVDKARVNAGAIGCIVKPTFNVKKLKFSFGNKIRASCNGLVVVIGPQLLRNRLPSYIVNPVTKQRLTLPYLPIEKLTQDSWGFAYAASSKVYKVVTFQESKFFIVSVGVDEVWREIYINYITFTKHNRAFCISLRGFVYWLNEDESDPLIISFDVETETFGKIRLPPHSLPHISSVLKSQRHYWTHNLHSYGLLALESSLCLWLRKSGNSYEFEFWLLKDRESEDGEWEKLHDINLKTRFHDIRKLLAYSRDISLLCPLGCLGSRELLVVFNEPQGAIVYNVNTGDIHPLKEFIIQKTQESVRTYDQGHVHVESLVRLPSCIPVLKHLRSTRSNPLNFIVP